jgi:hypothetical protein
MKLAERMHRLSAEHVCMLPGLRCVNSYESLMEAVDRVASALT